MSLGLQRTTEYGSDLNEEFDLIHEAINFVSSGLSVIDGKILILNSTDGTVFQGDLLSVAGEGIGKAINTSESTTARFLATETKQKDKPVKVIMANVGKVRVVGGTSAVIGKPAWLSSEAGKATATRPSLGTVQQIVGYFQSTIISDGFAVIAFCPEVRPHV